MPIEIVVADIDARQTHVLRHQVLRVGLPNAVVHFDCDDDPATWHLGALSVADGGVVGTSTYLPSATAHADQATAPFQLRGMAISPAVQGLGVGSRLLNAGCQRLRELGADILWAHARDTALGFYQAQGFRAVEGSGFISAETGLPHTVVLFDLR